MIIPVGDEVDAMVVVCTWQGRVTIIKLCIIDENSNRSFTSDQKH